MRLSRIVAAGAAAALIGVSTLAIGGTASADDFYVDDTEVEFVADGDAYLDSWFSGDTGAPGSADQGTATSTDSGLELSPADVVNGYQLLNGDTPATGLEALVAAAGFTMSAGDAKFQVPAFYTDDLDGDSTIEFTTLRPVNSNTLLGDWVSNSDIMDPADNTVTLFAANTAAPLAALLAAMPDYEILAFGVFASSDATVASITWNGDTHWFLPAPTATITPASLTVDAMEETGVSGVFTGFIPGEAVTAGFASAGSGGPISGSYTADGTGSVTITYSRAELATGTYFLSAEGADSGVFVVGEFEVTANVLPATGADVAPFIIGGSILLLAGAGLFGVTAVRRRNATQR